tara:strand:+ start:470 stop:1117 length:648 start_codon:yes stop_codon:yes gene_type:complete
MSSEINFQFIRPFGPIICKVTMPKEIVKNLNKYVDETIKNQKKISDLDHGKSLAGNVQQEFKLEKKFIEESKWGIFLSNCAKAWIKQTLGQEISKFQLIQSWIVRQFKNDYNPIHTHGGHLSGVGYLKVPESFGEYHQKTKVNNQNGLLTLVHGAKTFMSESTYTITPKVGDFYFFPNYLMHTVYPFTGTDDERRSVSFNAVIDEDVYNVFKQKK